MCNTKLIKLILLFRNGEDNSFFAIYKEFEKLIKVYSKQNEDWEQELTVFFIELLKTIDLSKFQKDDTISIHKYIAVSIRNKYIAISKNTQLYTQNIYDEDFFEVFFVYHDKSNQKIEVQDMFNRLPLKQRNVTIYHFIYGYSIAEISKLLKISRNATNNLKIRGLKKLKEMVGEDNV